jgi:hypothetical protein
LSPALLSGWVTSIHPFAPHCGLKRRLMFERFIAHHAILRDNLTLFGYDLVFRLPCCSRARSVVDIPSSIPCNAVIPAD